MSLIKVNKNAKKCELLLVVFSNKYFNLYSKLIDKYVTMSGYYSFAFYSLRLHSENGKTHHFFFLPNNIPTIYISIYPNHIVLYHPINN